MPDANSKVALVTGGSRGLGAEFARALGSTDYKIYITYLNNHEAAEMVVAEIGNGARAVCSDVSSASDCEALFKEISTLEGRLDVLVNNAGITEDALLVKTSDESWQRVIDTNLKGCMNTVRHSYKLMLSSGGGHIINVSSRSGLKGKVGQAAYSASKAGMLGATLSQARELGRRNIRVNALLPGYMPTEMGQESERALELARDESELNVNADILEAATFLQWLVSTKNITGQVFSLDSRINGW